MRTDDKLAPAAPPTSASERASARRARPPDHLPLNDTQWALFAACFAHVGAKPGLRHLMARSGEALRRAGLSLPEPLEPQHDVSHFDCGEEQLNKALQAAARRRTAGSGKMPPFVIAAGREVVGYYVVRPGSIFRAGGAESERIRIVIGRHYAVDRRWANNEIAADLLWHFVRTAYDSANESGARAVIGYGINLPVHRLYMRRGGRPLPKLVERRAGMITFADAAEALKAPVGPRDVPSVKPDSRLCIDNCVVRSERFAGAHAPGQFYLLDIDRGDSFGLNSVGARIWALLAAPIRIAAVCASLQSEFDVDAVACEREVLDLLETMLGRGMIAVASQDAPDAPPHASFKP